MQSSLIMLQRQTNLLVTLLSKYLLGGTSVLLLAVVEVSSLLFKGVASAIDVTIVNSQFLNNTADWGGGIEALFEDSASNNSCTSSFLTASLTTTVPMKCSVIRAQEEVELDIHFAGLNQTVKHNRVVIRRYRVPK